MVTGVLLVVSFAVMVAGAVVFTNAIEWVGVRLGLGHTAVGSVLAAVATAMPESLIPVIAVITGGKQADPVAIGAIIGAPFLLGTLALAVCAASALAYRARRVSPRLQPDRGTISRDLYVVLGALMLAVVVGLANSLPLRIAGAAVLVTAWAILTWKTVTQGRKEGGADEPGSLYFDTTKDDPPTNFQIILQVLVSIGLLIGGAQLFVSNIEHLATGLGVDPLILTLVIAPLATELPETLNSVIWVRQGKDTLALGNVTGAMVLQSMPLVAFGMLTTGWHLEDPALAAMAAALVGTVLGLIVLRHARYRPLPFIGCWTGLYLGGIASILAIT
jgi:cation:H+ antiporter